MSRIGRMPVTIPAKVSVNVGKGNQVTVTGPKGELTEKVSSDLTILQEDGQLHIERPSDQRHHRAQHGLARSLINNMVIGVTAGFSKVMEIQGVGYRAELQGQNLSLQLGKSHPVIYVPPANTTFEVSKDGRTLTVHGIDKCAVGQLASVIRKERKPEPYKGKGIRYRGEFVRAKAGKTGKVGKGGKK